MADLQPGTPEVDAPNPGTSEAGTPPAAAPEQPATTTPASAEPAPAEPVEQTAEPVEQAAKAVEPVEQAAEEPVKAVEQAAASTAPEVETTSFIPATAAAMESAEGGGEWELLLGKVQAWLGQGKLQALWAQARNPLTLILATAALLVVLRVYAALLGALESLPLIPGLLELVGLVWAVRFGLPKLVQRSQRQELISSIQQRWQSFRGRG
jgi:hypothetical protein